MLSGVACETRVLCPKLCSAGGIMLKVCWTKMKLSPRPPPPPPLGSLAQRGNQAFDYTKCTGYESKEFKVLKYSHSINFVHCRARSWQNL